MCACWSRFALFFVFMTGGAFAGAAEPSVVTSNFGRLGDVPVLQFTLTNRNAVQLKVIEYGATLTHLSVPDRDGHFASVILGADNLDTYVAGIPAAAVVGRYANRIRGARFTLDGKEFALTKNSGENHIHGGKRGFSKLLWNGLAVRCA